MNIIRWVLALIFLISPVSAWTIENPDYVYELTNANVSFPTNQSFSSIEHGADYIILNGSTYRIVPSQQTSVYINRYDTILDSYNITITGFVGTYQYTHEVNFITTTYNTYVDGVFFQAVASNSTGWLDNTIVLAGSNITLTYPMASLTQSVGYSCGTYVKSIVDVLVILFVGIGGALAIGFAVAMWKRSDTIDLRKGMVLYVFMIVLLLIGVSIVINMANSVGC